MYSKSELNDEKNFKFDYQCFKAPSALSEFNDVCIRFGIFYAY